MNLPHGRWLPGFRADLVAEAMPSIGLPVLVRCLLGERRFRPSGPTAETWNVAAHSLLVGLIMLRLRDHWPDLPGDVLLAKALCHDLHEAFLGDIPQPVKQHLPEFGRLEAEVDGGLLHEYLGIPVGTSPEMQKNIHAAVKHCDNVALVLEAELFGMTLETRPDQFPDNFLKDVRRCGGSGTWLYNEHVDFRLGERP